MKRRNYFSTRTGIIADTPEINLDTLKRLYIITYDKLEKEGYFQEYFGVDCVDLEKVGELGTDIDSVIFVNIHKDDLWPLRIKIRDYTEDDLFDMIEFMHDHCTKPISGTYHSYNNCGYHYNVFSEEDGHQDYREKLNDILKDYKEGYEISVKGEILSLPEADLAPLLLASIPSDDQQNIISKIELSTNKFRKYKSSLADRKDALRELADILEFLRPQIKLSLISKDENDLFNIINNFEIRHHNPQQKNHYDKAIWYSWMFYFYLATIHAALRLIEKNKSNLKL